MVLGGHPGSHSCLGVHSVVREIRGMFWSRAGDVPRWHVGFCAACGPLGSGAGAVLALSLPRRTSQGQRSLSCPWPRVGGTQLENISRCAPRDGGLFLLRLGHRGGPARCGAWPDMAWVLTCVCTCAANILPHSEIGLRPLSMPRLGSVTQTGLGILDLSSLSSPTGPLHPHTLHLWAGLSCPVTAFTDHNSAAR